MINRNQIQSDSPTPLDWRNWIGADKSFLPLEHLVRNLEEFSVFMAEHPVSDVGIMVTSRRAVPASQNQDRQQDIFIGSLYLGLRHIEDKIRHAFQGYPGLYVWTPDPFGWCYQRQFVESPVRMFLEFDGSRECYVNMAVMVASAEEVAQKGPQ